jgi:polysaccharide pyruvyl transferase CsaB
MNLGDEAILREMIRALRARLPVELTIFSLNPDDTQRRHDVERAVPVRDLSRAEVAEELRPLDLFILGGGGILFDPDVRQFLREAQIAKDLGLPVMTWAVGVGPLVSRESRRLILDVLNRLDLITVRESSARLVLEDIGVDREIRVTADPALLMEPEPIAADAIVAEGLAGAPRLIGISIREPGPAAPDLDVGHYHNLLANTADYLVERLDATVLFVPLERRIDLQHAHAVVSRMANPERAHVLKGQYTSGQMLSLMSRLDFAIGMRLHFLIFAALARVPFVPLPYASKVGGFVRELNIPALPIQQMNAGQLLAFVDRSWDRRLDLQTNIDVRLPPLIARSRQTADLAVGLLLTASRQSASAV